MISKKWEGQRLLEIDNVHPVDSGSPPTLDATEKYLGYFENSYGEQWVFIGDPKTGEAVIRGGDAGWEMEYKVSLSNPCPDNLILNKAEQFWLSICFMAMSNVDLKSVPLT
jgi:hypothetical protein